MTRSPSPKPKKSELRILTPIGMLGYGFGEEIFWTAVEAGVDAIILDSGSTDSGPQKLALGTSTCSREAYHRDLSKLVAAVHSHRTPVLIGSAGGDGSNQHTDMIVGIIKEIVKKNNYRSMKVLSIYADIPKDVVHEKLENGEIHPCGPVPELTKKDVDEATVIVAQMGLEPYLQAMDDNPDFDIIVGGRAYDPSPYAAFCLYNGFPDLGIAMHMGKLMECGAQCSVPKSKEALAIVREGSFDIVPLDPKARCTELSVAAHVLYEKSRPDVILGPGGALHLMDAAYEQLADNRTVRVSGAKFIPEAPGCYTIKLEGARACGYHSMFFGGMRDPILISQIDETLERIQSAVKEQIPFEYDLKFHVYGKNGVMGVLEPDMDTVPKEIAICGQVRAATQAMATHVVNLARIYCIHAPYPGQVAVGGNFAMPFAPYDIPMGQLTEFCVYHTMQIDDPAEHFPINVHMVDGTGLAPSWEVPAAHRRPLSLIKRLNGHIPKAITNGTARPATAPGSPTMNGHTENTNEVKSEPASPRIKNERVESSLKEVKVFRANSVGSERSSGTSTPQTGVVVADPLAKTNGAPRASPSPKTATGPRKPRKYYLTPAPAEGHCYLGDLSCVIRSKNAGPFELTFDIMFNDEETYSSVKSSGVLTPIAVAKMYHIEERDVQACIFWDPARSFKATIRRPIVSGSFGDADVHASQQHIPFLYVLLPIPRV